MHLRRRGRLSDIQPLGCGCHGLFAERSRWCKGVQEFLTIRVREAVRSVRLASGAGGALPNMVLSGSRGLQLDWVIRGGIRWRVRLSGLTRERYSPSNPRAERPNGLARRLKC